MSKVWHRKKSLSWWNGTVTAMCGLTVSKSDVVTSWFFASTTCPGCRAAIKAAAK